MVGDNRYELDITGRRKVIESTHQWREKINPHIDDAGLRVINH
jgi:hypothetical protein